MRSQLENAETPNEGARDGTVTKGEVTTRDPSKNDAFAAIYIGGFRLRRLDDRNWIVERSYFKKDGSVGYAEHSAAYYGTLAGAARRLYELLQGNQAERTIEELIESNRRHKDAIVTAVAEALKKHVTGLSDTNAATSRTVGKGGGS